MKKLFYMLVISFFLIPSVANAGVLFEDDFDTTTWSSDWYADANQDPPGPFTTVDGDPSVSCNGSNEYGAEVTSPGREGVGDRAYKVNRCGVSYMYGSGGMRYGGSSMWNHQTKEIYQAWYMKVPSDFTQAEGACAMGYTKFGRWNFDTSSDGTGGIIYLNMQGNSWTSGSFQVTTTAGAGGWQTLTSTASVTDGAWHHHEIRLKLNTQGNSDGVLQYWLDGEPKVDRSNITWGATSNDYFTRIPMGIGNTGARSSVACGCSASCGYCCPQGEWPSSWRAIEYDDMVLSTERVGDVECTPSDDTVTNSGDTILFDGFESGTSNEWRCDYVAGDTSIDTDTTFGGCYSFKQPSSNAGNIVHMFGDHQAAGSCNTAPDGIWKDDITLEGQFYYEADDSSFTWPSGAVKIWLIDSFESWAAGCNQAEGSGKPHTWAPYYITVYANSDGEPMMQIVRADGLQAVGDCNNGYTDGALWEDYVQNVGDDTALATGEWQKLKVRIKLNTSGQSDGIFQLWLNDTLEASYSNINYRGTYTDYGWNHIMSSFDPEPSHPESQYVIRDNITLTAGADTTPPTLSSAISGGSMVNSAF